ncbi:alcohol dehydrogenase catalytic domain-containing protein [Leucobacter allii]|uniref:zinc-dependent alcohol dehydrogenase n=1 Tax=Leucobacter allii TaxID=2932247 RepID=UPI001FD2DBE0|nr:alcohol dehydrogenase catalytic domain-containing protein [Leucobacter allii]UOR01352.1 alcohol dehydrogenase catalytic domain-containing protein [Leucobacter allii]
MTEQMQAAVYYGAHDVRLERVDVPEPGAGEVLIKVTRSGVCGTDASEWKAGPKIFPVEQTHPHSGHHGPLILGHEFIGEVVRSEDPRFSIGERVASGAGVSCGECDRCREGRTNLCERYRTYGLNVDGGMAQYVAVAADTLVGIPDRLDDDAAGLSQPLAVGLHAARRAGVKPGDRVLLIGAGAIGTFVLAGLKHLVDADITVVDFGGSRLERASRVGASRVIAVDDESFEGEMAALRGSLDVVIEASGAPGQLNRAIGLTRDGGAVLQVGLPTTAQEVDIHQLVFREITIRTTLAHVCAADMPESLTILGTTKLADELLDSVRPLRELPDQLERLATGRIEGKVLFDPAR